MLFPACAGVIPTASLRPPSRPTFPRLRGGDPLNALKIDPEFQGKIPPLTFEELNQLEANILRDGRIVFNIARNKYRIVVWINYAYRVVYIRFIGTHKQYDEIDAQSI